MSITTLLNSTNAFNDQLTLSNSLATGAQLLAANDGSTLGDLKVICVTNAATSAYLTVPAGTYNIQMICGLEPSINSSLSYAQLKIVDNSGNILAYSSSKSFESGDTANNYVRWVFNESQRVVFGVSTQITMNLLYSNVVKTGNIQLYNTVVTGTTIDITPRIILTPTF